jgi:hypothetical protein
MKTQTQMGWRRLAWVLAAWVLAGCGNESSADHRFGTQIWQDGPREAQSPDAVAHDRDGGLIGFDADSGRVVTRLSFDDARTVVFDPWHSELLAVQGARIVALDDDATLTWASPHTSLHPLRRGFIAIDDARWRWLAWDGSLIDTGSLLGAYSLSSPHGRRLYALENVGRGVRLLRVPSDDGAHDVLWQRASRAPSTLAQPLRMPRANGDAAVLPATLLVSAWPRSLRVELLDGHGESLQSLTIPRPDARLLDLSATPTAHGGWRTQLLLGGRQSELLTIDAATELRWSALRLARADNTASCALGQRLGPVSDTRLLIALDDRLVAVDRDRTGWHLDHEFVGHHLRLPFAVLHDAADR